LHASETSVCLNGEIICDDYFDEIFVPETWQATVIQASSLTAADVAGDVKFGGMIGINRHAAIAGISLHSCAFADDERLQIRATHRNNHQS
jgi:hypothetical protein